MKKLLVWLMVAIMSISCLVACSAQPAPAPAAAQAPAAAEAAAPANETAPAAETEAAPAFKPEATGEWVINYNAGSGADIFTRACTTALLDGNICATNLPVVAKPEGSGVVAMQYIIDISNQKQANNTLITLGGGDVTEAIEIAGINADGLRPLAVMAAETPLLVMRKDSKYQNFMEAVDAMLAGTQVVFCGPQNDYELMAENLRTELGVSNEVFTYIPYSSGKEGLTALLGGHAEFAFCTPAHGAEMIASGDIIPQWIYSAQHYQFGSLSDLPTLSELSNGKYKDAEHHVYRIVWASAKMEDAAADYWIDCLEKLTHTASWEKYCADFSMTTMFMPREEALPYK